MMTYKAVLLNSEGNFREVIEVPNPSFDNAKEIFEEMGWPVLNNYYILIHEVNVLNR